MRSTRVISLFLALLVAIGHGWPSVVHAADETELRAKQKFKEGQAHFAAGRYREAASSYESAYALKPLPAFLFNLGQCYRNLREPARAITYFKAYLLDAP